MMTDREKKELEEKLKRQLEAREISLQEAEDEWQDVFNPEPRYCGREW